MIKRLVVKGLNNRVDGTHDLEFHPDLNIFTGPNGSGKTTLLKLIWYLISGNLERIFPEIPLQSVSIETDVCSLEMAWVETQKWDDTLQFDGQHTFGESKVELKWRFTGEKEFSETLSVDSETKAIHRADVDKINALKKRLAQTTKSSLFFPTFRRIEGGFSRGFRRSTPIRRMPYRATERLQEGMSGLSEEVSVANHKFVSSISTDDIASLLAQRYAAISERINELQVKLSAEIKQKIRDHSGDGTSALSAIQESVQRVDDGRESALKPFSVLANLTQEILQYQSIEVTGRILRDEGAERIVLGKGKDGIALGQVESIISSDKLSAGEKQMLSFLCYNAFSDNAAIFIDEPELSLHVDWQELLLRTLLEQATDNQFFVATHSPFIYTIYPDKEFLLGDNRGYQGKI